MRLFTTTKRRAAVAVTVGTIFLAGGGAAAYAASASTSPSPTSSSTSSSTSPSTAPKNTSGHHRSALARADHATLEVRRHGRWVTITFDRGNVTAASTTSITLARPDGQSVTLAISPTTRFRGKEATSAAALKTGVRAQVRSIDGVAIAVTEGTTALRSK